MFVNKTCAHNKVVVYDVSVHKRQHACDTLTSYTTTLLCAQVLFTNIWE